LDYEIFLLRLLRRLLDVAQAGSLGVAAPGIAAIRDHAGFSPHDYDGNRRRRCVGACRPAESRCHRAISRRALVAFLFGWHIVVLVGAGGGGTSLRLRGSRLARAFLLEAAIVLVSVIGGLALLGLSRGYGFLSRVLSSKPLLYLGAISYSFYLWHIIGWPV